MPYNKDLPLEDQVEQSFLKSLSNLRTDYIDSYLLHTALPFEDMKKIWTKFEEFYSKKQVNYLGISNIYDIR